MIDQMSDKYSIHNHVYWCQSVEKRFWPTIKQFTVYYYWHYQDMTLICVSWLNHSSGCQKKNIGLVM